MYSLFLLSGHARQFFFFFWGKWSSCLKIGDTRNCTSICLICVTYGVFFFWNWKILRISFKILILCDEIYVFLKIIFKSFPQNISAIFFSSIFRSRILMLFIWKYWIGCNSRSTRSIYVIYIIIIYIKARAKCP